MSEVPNRVHPAEALFTEEMIRHAPAFREKLYELAAAVGTQVHIQHRELLENALLTDTSLETGLSQPFTLVSLNNRDFDALRTIALLTCDDKPHQGFTIYDFVTETGTRLKNARQRNAKLLREGLVAREPASTGKLNRRYELTDRGRIIAGIALVYPSILERFTHAGRPSPRPGPRRIAPQDQNADLPVVTEAFWRDEYDPYPENYLYSPRLQEIYTRLADGQIKWWHLRDWGLLAACRDQEVDTFYENTASTVSKLALKVCMGCEVRQLCRDYTLAVETEERHGITGGMTPAQRDDACQSKPRLRRELIETAYASGFDLRHLLPNIPNPPPPSAQNEDSRQVA